MKRKISVNSLLKMIDSEVLKTIAIETNVDYKSKKLSGEIVFKLLMMSILDNTKISLRIMEKTFSNSLFKLFSGVDKEETIKYNSISERLTSINCSYFEEIYKHVFQLSTKYFTNEVDEYCIRQFDSTSLTISSKLLKKGMVNGLKNKKGEHHKNQIKFTVGLLNNLPDIVNFYNEQKYLGEDLTLSQTILESVIDKNEVVVFDRGLKKRTVFKKFNEKNILFVTRINPTKSIKVIEQNPLDKNSETETLKLISDEKVNLYHEKKILLKEPFRLIKSQSKKTSEEIYFLTNIQDLKAYEITEIYKKRLKSFFISFVFEDQ